VDQFGSMQLLLDNSLPVALAEVDCDGTESSLLDCSSSDSAIPGCGLSNTDAPSGAHIATNM